MNPRQGPGASEADAERNRAFGAGLVDDPYPTYHRLRAAAPMRAGTLEDQFPDVGLMSPSSMWGSDQITVLSYEGCSEVLRRHEHFSSHWYDRTLTLVVGPTIVGMDEPEHSRVRMLLKNAFAKSAIASWWENELIRPAVNQELEAVLPRGHADLYEEIAARVPVHTIVAGLGLPVEDRGRFFDWAVAMTSGEPPDRLRSSQAVADYVAPLIASRRASPRRDLITMLASAEIPDDERDGIQGDTHPLSDDEINGFIRLLIIAGAGTTYRAYGNLMFQLLTHPDQLREVRADRSLVEGAIYESLRIEQPVAVVGRLAVEDTAIQGVPVRKGCCVNAVIGAANHDPDVFPDPERFDVRRPNAHRNLSFGFGIHRCLGQHLALTELRILLERTLDLLDDLSFDPDAGPVHQTGLGFRMPTALPVRFRAVRTSSDAPR